MTQLRTAHIGSYPRVGEHKDQQRYRRGLTHFQNGDISAHGFRDVLQSVVQELIREQIESGIDEITDGLVSWSDPITKFCEKIAGIKITGLNRYFDTNFYYRIPVITAKPRKKEPIVIDDFQTGHHFSEKPLRVILTGPLTLAAHTESSLKPYDKLSARVQFFTDVLAEEISQLVLKGADVIQIDEPSLAQRPSDIGLVRDYLAVFAPLTKPIKLVLALYYAPLASLYDELITLPVHAFNLDFTTDGKKLFDKMMQRGTKVNIGFGLVNARTTRLEAIDPILNSLKQWIEKVEPDVCYLTPSSGLELITREAAVAKLKLISKIKEEILKVLDPTKVHG